MVGVGGCGSGVLSPAAAGQQVPAPGGGREEALPGGSGGVCGSPEALGPGLPQSARPALSVLAGAESPASGAWLWSVVSAGPRRPALGCRAIAPEVSSCRAPAGQTLLDAAARKARDSGPPRARRRRGDPETFLEPCEQEGRGQAGIG